MRELERVIMLRVVDEYWMDQIDAMNDLKQGIGLRGYAQTDPVVAYKKEGYEMFEQMIAAIQEETLRRLFLVRYARTRRSSGSGWPRSPASPAPATAPSSSGPSGRSSRSAATIPVPAEAA